MVGQRLIPEAPVGAAAERKSGPHALPGMAVIVESIPEAPVEVAAEHRSDTGMLSGDAVGGHIGPSGSCW